METFILKLILNRSVNGVRYGGKMKYLSHNGRHMLVLGAPSTLYSFQVYAHIIRREKKTIWESKFNLVLRPSILNFTSMQMAKAVKPSAILVAVQYCVAAERRKLNSENLLNRMTTQEETYP